MYWAGPVIRSGDENESSPHRSWLPCNWYYPKNENRVGRSMQNHPPAAVPDVGCAPLKFGKAKEFQLELRRRVEAYFAAAGRGERDCPAMYLKSAIILAGFALGYVLLVFFAKTWWEAVPLAVFTGFTMAEIGFNIMHDASHKAYSDRPWDNKLMTMSLDLVGGSSYIW